MKDAWHGDMQKIKEAVCSEFNVSINELVSSRVNKKIYPIRQIAYYLCRELTPSSLPMIGRAFGNRDHTTIMHGIARAKDIVKEYPTILQKVKKVRETLNGQA